MRSRSEVLAIYQRFVAMVRTQYSTPICVFRADSAGEYISQVIQAIYYPNIADRFAKNIVTDNDLVFYVPI